MNTMIIFYVLYILTPINTNAESDYDISKNPLGIIEDGKPILRDGGNHELQEKEESNIFLDEFSSEFSEMKSSKNNQETEKNLRIFVHWLMNNYGYTIPRPSRRMGDDISSDMPQYETKKSEKKRFGDYKKKSPKKSKHRNEKNKENVEISSEEMKKKQLIGKKNNKIHSERIFSLNLKNIINILRNKISQYGIHFRNGTNEDNLSDRNLSIALSFDLK